MPSFDQSGLRIAISWKAQYNKTIAAVPQLKTRRMPQEDTHMEKKNTAVVTVVGNDTIGIIAKVSAVLSEHEANILDISQTVLSGMFNMIMIVDISLSRFSQLSEALEQLGIRLGLQIRIQRSEIFDAMHRI